MSDFNSTDDQSWRDEPDPQPECLQRHDGRCEGSVEYRMSLSGTGTSIPRCDYHWAKRLETEEEHNRKYPVLAPSDFDPDYAGERWDDEY